MKYTTGLAEYKLIPEFLNVSFTKNKGDISIEQFVKNLYEVERIDILVQIFKYLEPESYYLGYHGYFDVENVNPLVDFYTSYNVETGKRERDRKVITYHTNIDTGILKKHAYSLFELQKELNEILDGINAAQK
ncbi:hypothetical protein [Virgibacillus sp. LDC-1]|uniref:hypothetical protein n=1 Tax=Virgibacillus sp. LDC-1 TaxID=3039856 RepID=UPI0024DE5895|nr:hypothetical protein [Virgibacillus sp. LDC-1]